LSAQTLNSSPKLFESSSAMNGHSEIFASKSTVSGRNSNVGGSLSAKTLNSSSKLFESSSAMNGHSEIFAGGSRGSRGSSGNGVKNSGVEKVEKEKVEPEDTYCLTCANFISLVRHGRVVALTCCPEALGVCETCGLDGEVGSFCCERERYTVDAKSHKGCFKRATLCRVRREGLDLMTPSSPQTKEERRIFKSFQSSRARGGRARSGDWQFAGGLNLIIATCGTIKLSELQNSLEPSCVFSFMVMSFFSHMYSARAGPENLLELFTEECDRRKTIREAHIRKENADALVQDRMKMYVDEHLPTCLVKLLEECRDLLAGIEYVSVRQNTEATEYMENLREQASQLLVDMTSTLQQVYRTEESELCVLIRKDYELDFAELKPYWRKFLHVRMFVRQGIHPDHRSRLSRLPGAFRSVLDEICRGCNSIDEKICGLLQDSLESRSAIVNQMMAAPKILQLRESMEIFDATRAETQPFWHAVTSNMVTNREETESESSVSELQLTVTERLVTLYGGGASGAGVVALLSPEAQTMAVALLERNDEHIRPTLDLIAMGQNVGAVSYARQADALFEVGLLSQEEAAVVTLGDAATEVIESFEIEKEEHDVVDAEVASHSYDVEVANEKKLAETHAKMWVKFLELVTKMYLRSTSETKRNVCLNIFKTEVSCSHDDFVSKMAKVYRSESAISWFGKCRRAFDAIKPAAARKSRNDPTILKLVESTESNVVTDDPMAGGAGGVGSAGGMGARSMPGILHLSRLVLDDMTGCYKDLENELVAPASLKVKIREKRKVDGRVKMATVEYSLREMVDSLRRLLREKEKADYCLACEEVNGKVREIVTTPKSFYKILRKFGIEAQKTPSEVLALKDRSSKKSSKRSKGGKYLSHDEATFDNQVGCDWCSIREEVTDSEDESDVFTEEEIEEEERRIAEDAVNKSDLETDSECETEVEQVEPVMKKRRGNIYRIMNPNRGTRSNGRKA